MKRWIIIALVSLFACNRPQYANPHILIETGYGDIEVELYPDKAPKTVAAFLSFIDSGFYKQSSFYRVLLTEGITDAGNIGLIQGGIYQTNNNQDKAAGIVHESTKQTGLSHTDGTISLARTTPGSASTEFFICIGDQLEFDYGNGSTNDKEGYAAFGKVVKGMGVVRTIQRQRNHNESFDEKIMITNIEKL